MVEYGHWEIAVSDVKGKMERGELIPDPDWQRGLYLETEGRAVVDRLDSQENAYPEVLSDRGVRLEKAYKESVLGAIRDKAKRLIRVNVLQKMIKKHAKPLDPKRFFPETLKQKLWHGKTVCKICTKTIGVYGSAAVDHIEPWAKGGRTVEENAQLAHRTCNQRKQAQFEEFILLST